jgi:hypothetical protein
VSSLPSSFAWAAKKPNAAELALTYLTEPRNVSLGPIRITSSPMTGLVMKCAIAQ